MSELNDETRLRICKSILKEETRGKLLDAIEAEGVSIADFREALDRVPQEELTSVLDFDDVSGEPEAFALLVREIFEEALGDLLQEEQMALAAA